MVRHKWKIGDIHFNFCVKCGIKRFYAGSRGCTMVTRNLEKKLPHKIEILHKRKYSWDIYKCSVCDIEGRRWGRWNLIFSTSDTGIAYVPYHIVEVNGKLRAKNIRYFKRKRGKLIGIPEVAYWPIYCGLTEDEYICKDIIL